MTGPARTFNARDNGPCQENQPTRAIKGNERVESPHEPSAASCPVDLAGVVFDCLSTGNHSEKAGRNLEF
jgi:hypothetical protein